MVLLIKIDGYQKCVTNKNVTKMDMIIKGVYCTTQWDDVLAY